MKFTLKGLRKSITGLYKRRPPVVEPDTLRQDEEAVRAGQCSFQVVYLGCMEVYDRDSGEACCEALRGLRKTRRLPIHATLWISGEGVRVIEMGTRDVLVDLDFGELESGTSDPRHHPGFGFVSTDAKDRWMFYGFSAVRNPGVRLAYAFGAAIDVYVEGQRLRVGPPQHNDDEGFDETTEEDEEEW